jgi:hypothetical protein
MGKNTWQPKNSDRRISKWIIGKCVDSNWTELAKTKVPVLLPVFRTLPVILTIL